MEKNKSTLGLAPFIQEIYEDAKAGITTGWWNEQYNRKGETLNIILADKVLETPYDLINFIIENHSQINQEELDEVKDYVSHIYMVLNYKRVYHWAVDESKNSPESKPLKFSSKKEKEPAPEKEVVSEEKEDQEDKKDSPDFEYARTIEDRKELKDYAAKFGIELDARKSTNAMMKSFQGKYHATKNK